MTTCTFNAILLGFMFYWNQFYNKLIAASAWHRVILLSFLLYSLYCSDCIGSAFNIKGAMQCPNCRKIEKGQWLYANGCRSYPEFSMDEWTHDEDLYDLSYSEMVIFTWPYNCFCHFVSLLHHKYVFALVYFTISLKFNIAKYVGCYFWTWPAHNMTSISLKCYLY